MGEKEERNLGHFIRGYYIEIEYRRSYSMKILIEAIKIFLIKVAFESTLKYDQYNLVSPSSLSFATIYWNFLNISLIQYFSFYYYFFFLRRLSSTVKFSYMSYFFILKIIYYYLNLSASSYVNQKKTNQFSYISFFIFLFLFFFYINNNTYFWERTRL